MFLSIRRNTYTNNYTRNQTFSKKPNIKNRPFYLVLSSTYLAMLWSAL